VDLEVIGKWSFIVGLAVAVLTGLLAGFLVIPYTAVALLVLGLVVGFLNVTAKETDKFLISAIALIAVGVASIQAAAVLGVLVSGMLNTVLANFIAFVGAAALVVSVKALVEMGTKK
jgi:hypothetical protein